MVLGVMLHRESVEVRDEVYKLRLHTKMMMSLHQVHVFIGKEAYVLELRSSSTRVDFVMFLFVLHGGFSLFLRFPTYQYTSYKKKCACVCVTKNLLN